MLTPKLKITLLATVVNCILLSGYAHSQTQPQIIQSSAPISLVPGNNLTVFGPKSQTKNTRIDYQLWDDVLRNIVVDLGPSTRFRSTRPNASTGTRRVTGHISPYRLEGSRVAFGFLNDSYKTVLTDYRKDLQDVASTLDITRLSRDEQLAYWFNLHNVAIIEQIALAYPTDDPSKILVKVNGVDSLLDDAKFIKVKGQTLSLRDIREKIVYPNWSEPRTIYGFFRGNIGSPRMPRLAYTASNIEYQLNGGATEFVNALRGFHEVGKTRKFSAIYGEVKEFYFPNFDADLTTHLLKYAEDDTIEEVKAGRPFKMDKYEQKIADLSGGRRTASAVFVEGSTNLPPEVQRLLSEVGQKQEYLRSKGYYSGFGKGYVIIEDIETTNESTIKE